MTAIVVFVIIFFLWINLFFIPRAEYSVYCFFIKEAPPSENAEIPKGMPVQLSKKISLLERKVERLAPGGSYLIVNTTDNTFRLFKNRQILREGLCSTGSYIQLEADSAGSWLFETPKGMLSVLNKIQDPVWRKPDWAFIEEGLKPPPPDHPSRYERGVLGDYALDLGNGYLIHGTLYQRLIGMPVTHGCIRMKDEDLFMVYSTLRIGSKVYIY